ncbi:MAG: hypothetical protein QOF76_4673, partial [Solirubrobacteraceae bacterium]|nr:hypothetical protein [Solirubrobacteraceae bacterium]
AWANLDAAVKGALARGIAVNLNLTAPAPLWATKEPPRADIATTFEPDPKAFSAFVRAVGTRYSGDFTPEGGDGPLPRVDYWSIWNEPNHSSWLTPTWQQDSAGVWFERSAALYRSLMDAGYGALKDSGHGSDTILIGETAPSGQNKQAVKQFMKPLVFVRALYCLDDKLQPLTGDAAARLDCPANPADMANDHPGLFAATGYAHHPYGGLSAPTVPIKDPGVVTIADLGKLERVLDRAQQEYGKSRKLPLYLTEYGYQTAPDAIALPLRLQAKFLNQSEWLTFKDPRVKTLGQFLLVDDGPPLDLTFQSGLIKRNGVKKPSFAAYRVPLWVSGTGPHKRVWGLLRPAAAGEAAKADLQFRASGGDWKTLQTLTAHGKRNVVRTKVTVSTAGAFRLVYGDDVSRTMGVKVR